jgi:hypothetical protein
MRCSKHGRKRYCSVSVHCLSTTAVENATPCTIADSDARYDPRDSIYIMVITAYQATHFPQNHNYILSTCRRRPLECPPECPHIPVRHLPITQAANSLMVRQGNTKVTRRLDPQLRRPSAKCLRVFRCRISPASHQKIDPIFQCLNAGCLNGGTPPG